MKVRKKFDAFFERYAFYSNYRGEFHRKFFIVFGTIFVIAILATFGGKVIGQPICEFEGNGDWDTYDGYYGSCWNISEETCNEIGGSRELSSLNGLPTCILDPFGK